MGEKGHRRHFLRQMSLAMLLMACGRPLQAVHAAVPEERGEAQCVTLRNLHTGEELLLAGMETGKAEPQTLTAIDRLLRCHFTDEVYPIDRRLIDLLLRLNRRVDGCSEIDIISGYRSPAYNEILRRQSNGVARNSLHLQGKAIDLRIPGVGLGRLRQAAIALHRGGVGYYPASGFIHLDVGLRRSWQG